MLKDTPAQLRSVGDHSKSIWLALSAVRNKNSVVDRLIDRATGRRNIVSEEVTYLQSWKKEYGFTPCPSGDTTVGGLGSADLKRNNQTTTNFEGMGVRCLFKHTVQTLYSADSQSLMDESTRSTNQPTEPLSKDSHFSFRLS